MCVESGVVVRKRDSEIEDCVEDGRRRRKTLKYDPEEEEDGGAGVMALASIVAEGEERVACCAR